MLTIHACDSGNVPYNSIHSSDYAGTMKANISIQQASFNTADQSFENKTTHKNVRNTGDIVFLIDYRKKALDRRNSKQQTNYCDVSNYVRRCRRMFSVNRSLCYDVNTIPSR